MRRVLLMDDEPMIRAVLLEMLNCLGVEATACSEGLEALACMHAAAGEGRPYQVAILDLVVASGMGGQETVGRLKSLWPTLRAVVSSGHSNEPASLRPADHGFDASLPKPYTLDELHRVIEPHGG